MVNSFDLLKHFFSPKQWATILLQLITQSLNHWTFATGKLFVKDRLTFLLVDSKLKKKTHNPKNPILQTVYLKARFVFKLGYKENAGH